VGDSRAYCFRDGRLQQITEDQTWEAYSLKHNVENKHGNALRQAIGVDERIVPETYRITLHPEDWLLLCSDGLYKMVELSRVEEVLGQSRCAEEACDLLLSLALDGGGRDNVGICVARYENEILDHKPLNVPLLVACGALAIVLLLLMLAIDGKI
jgi:protein phosphatase